MSTGQTTMDMDATRSLAKRVQELAQSYQNEVNRVYTSVDNLKNGWKGNDNQAYVTRVYEHKENIEALGKAILDYGTFLENAANAMSKHVENIADAAGTL